MGFLWKQSISMEVVYFYGSSVFSTLERFASAISCDYVDAYVTQSLKCATRQIDIPDCI